MTREGVIRDVLAEETDASVPEFPGTIEIAGAIQEWWCYPMVTWTGSRMLLGGITSDRGDGMSDVFIAEWCPGWTTWAVTVVGRTPVDDHNTPTPVVAGDRVLLVWAEHSMEDRLWIAWSDLDGSLESMARNPVRETRLGSPVSYAQVVEIAHLSTSQSRTLWAFTRKDSTEWGWLPITVDQSETTDPVQVGEYRPLVASPGRQCYITIAEAFEPSEQVIRISWGFNPAQPVHHVRAFEVRPESGVISSPFDPSLNVRCDDAALPLRVDQIAEALPDLPATASRRLYYTRPGPAAWAIGCAEWQKSAPDSAMQFVYDWTVGGRRRRPIAIAGPRVGYIPQANYTGTVTFPDPCHDDVVAICRRGDDGVDHIELRGPQGVVEVARSSTHRLIRPYFPRGAGAKVLVYSRVRSYGDTGFSGFDSDIVMIHVGRRATAAAGASASAEKDPKR